MLLESRPEQVDDIRPEFDGQQAQQQETHKAAGEDSEQEAQEAHLRNRRRQDEQFEGRWWRKHRRQHEAPEGMLVEGRVNLREARRRDPLAQQFLPALVTDHVDYDAAQSRPSGCHKSVEKKSGVILINIAGHDRIHGKANEGAVERSHD